MTKSSDCLYTFLEVFAYEVSEAQNTAVKSQVIKQLRLSALSYRPQVTPPRDKLHSSLELFSSSQSLNVETIR